MTKENLVKLFSFKTLYLVLLLTFVILHLVLLVFGLSFTPILWNSWFFILCLALFIHPWRVFFRTRDFQWYHLIFQIFSGLVALYLWFMAFFVLSIIPKLLNPFIMKSEVKYNEDLF